ncbi:MAG: hypothetical protein ACI9AR_000530 [Flavobacteriaceae bacterium]|jgi:hypothetical protein
MNNEKESLSNLQQKKEHLINRVFWIGLQILLIVGLPAGVVILLAEKFGKKTAYATIPVALIFSIVMVVLVIRRIDKKIKDIDTAIQSHPDFIDRGEILFEDEKEKLEENK